MGCFDAALAATTAASLAAFSRKTAPLKSRMALVANSWLAIFLCCLHLSPSTAKIPSPSRSP